jgi:hypothetical protein
MKKIFNIIMIVCITTFTISCSNIDSINDSKENLTIPVFSIDLNLQTVFERKDVNLEDLLEALVSEIYEFELEDVELDPETISLSPEIPSENYFGVDINITDHLIIINPISGQEPISVLGDDAKCGGKQGDGWKSYGTCLSEGFVADKVAEVKATLSESVTSGTCLDVRIKRNLTNARVCARVVSC